MFNEGKLWRERFAWTSKEIGRYLRYILNGHLIVVALFLFGTGAFYYQEYVKTLTADFPIAIIMALIIGIFLNYSPINTFLQEADRVFLLPLETKLANYFKKSLAVSLVLQIYLLLMILALFMPAYVKVYSGEYKSFFAFLAVIAVMKFWNLLIRWQVQYFVNPKIHLLDSIIRYGLNLGFLYFLFSRSYLFVAIFMLGIIGLYVFYQKRTADMGLKWEYLIDLEEKRMTSFYRIANLFTDVPKLKDQVKRRIWLDWLLESIRFGQINTYSYLYWRTFLRAGDYFGLALRLTAIGAGALYLISFGFGQVLVVVLFLYLTGFQLLPLANHHQNKVWVSLYPLADIWRQKAVQKLLFIVLLFEAIILDVILLIKGELMVSLISLLCSVIFIYYFVFVYGKKRLKSI